VFEKHNFLSAFSPQEELVFGSPYELAYYRASVKEPGGDFLPRKSATRWPCGSGLAVSSLDSESFFKEDPIAFPVEAFFLIL
jgi:hypothetical protein